MGVSKSMGHDRIYIVWRCSWICDGRSRKENQIYQLCLCFSILHHLLTALSVNVYKTSNDVRCSKPIFKLFQLLKSLEVFSLYFLVFVLGIFTGIIESVSIFASTKFRCLAIAVGSLFSNVMIARCLRYVCHGTYHQADGLPTFPLRCMCCICMSISGI